MGACFATETVAAVRSDRDQAPGGSMAVFGGDSLAQARYLDARRESMSFRTTRNNADQHLERRLLGR